MTQNQQIIERDFYYKKQVSASHTLKYLGISLLSNFAAYYYVVCCTSLLSVFTGTATYIFLQVILTIPLTIFLPPFLICRYISSVVPKLYSLADDPQKWHAKAIRLMVIPEIIRFMFGILPVNFLNYGVITSPVTYCLYSLFYITPLKKFDEVLLEGHVSIIDTVVFLLIYMLYYLIYEYVIFKKIRKEVMRHNIYLEGCLNEKLKTQSYK